MPLRAVREASGAGTEVRGQVAGGTSTGAPHVLGAFLFASGRQRAFSAEPTPIAFARAFQFERDPVPAGGAVASDQRRAGVLAHDKIDEAIAIEIAKRESTAQ